MIPDLDLLIKATLRQTAIELLRLYEETKDSVLFEPLDEDALLAWGRIAQGVARVPDLELIRMRRAVWNGGPTLGCAAQRRSVA